MIECSEVIAYLDSHTQKYHAVLCDPPYGLSFMGKIWNNYRPSDHIQLSLFQELA
jgi:hypothetical protein